MGVYFGNNKEKCEKLNWENKIDKLKTLGQMEQNVATEVLGWSSFNSLSCRSRLDQRWPSAGVYGTVKDSGIIQVSDTGYCEPLVKDCDTLDNFIIY